MLMNCPRWAPALFSSLEQAGSGVKGYQEIDAGIRASSAPLLYESCQPDYVEVNSGEACPAKSTGWAADIARSSATGCKSSIGEQITVGDQRRCSRLDREVVLDITLLSRRLARTTPSGIERVNASFAAHFLATDKPNRKALLSTPLGPRAIRAGVARRIYGAVQRRWRETQSPETDGEFLRVREALAGLQSPPQTRSWSQHTLSYARAGLLQFAAWCRIDEITANAVYLNVGQSILHRPRYTSWLRARPDVKPVFMIHDLLPIEHPEFFRPREFQIHTKKLNAVARFGAGAIVSTASVAEAFLAYLARLGRKAMPIIVAPLSVSPVFCEPREHDETLAARPYFVICGTIEPRKNHLLLFNLWRRLARSMGPETPKLVVVGVRGWENENALDMLDRCPELREHVIEVSGLSTPAVKRLLDNARALLMPSFAEGYGLPVAEALAAGTPVIASDLSCFRAMGERGLTLLDPLDGVGWSTAIGRLCEGPPPWAQGPENRSKIAISSDLYFGKIEAFLASV